MVRTESFSGGSYSRATRRCPHCGGYLDERVPRPLLFKLLLGWLPVKRYLCFRCYKKSYIRETSGRKSD